MRLRILGISLLLVVFASCKSDFERVRLSGDTQLIYDKGIALFEKGEYQKAQTLFELIINSFRGQKEAEDLYFKYAYTHYHLKNYILASYYFKNFSTTYSLSTLKEEADFMAAFSNYRMSPQFRLEQSFTQKAIDGLQDFVNTYPRSERVAECNQLIDGLRAKLEKKAFAEAKLYYDLRQYQAALHTFENLLKDFPETKDAEFIRYLMVDAAFAWAENSVVDKKAERYEKTLEFARLFRAKYPSSTYSEELSRTESETRKALNTI
ncbi:MAG: outer membrane protein assembly factor BamD [Saprospiraceae bacterium]|nr:outer membrane protein assembly factor BamD [Saprospiraceae bacterium]